MYISGGEHCNSSVPIRIDRGRVIVRSLLCLVEWLGPGF